MSLKQTVHSTKTLLTAIWIKRHLLKQFRAEAIPVIKKYLKTDDVCIDVGAHAGAYSMPLSNIVKDGHVYAFEAFPYYAEVLSQTIKVLGKKNITVVNKAVTDENRLVQIAWKHGNGRWFTQTTHMARIGEDLIEPLMVEGITLDTFIKTHVATKVRFVKIDVEGGELMVLRGASKLIEAARPICYLELYREYCRSYGYEPEEVFNIFEKMEYGSFIISNESSIKPVDRLTYEGRGDILFIPAEKNEG
jgi:FkbM family methyltransferase